MECAQPASGCVDGVILGSHNGASGHHFPESPLPSPCHKESFWIWESSSKASQNIINIQQRETIRLSLQEDHRQLASYQLEIIKS